MYRHIFIYCIYDFYVFSYFYMSCMYLLFLYLLFSFFISRNSFLLAFLIFLRVSSNRLRFVQKLNKENKSKNLYPLHHLTNEDWKLGLIKNIKWKYS